MGNEVQEAVRNVETHLIRKGLSLRKITNSLLTGNYCPKLEISPELGSDDASYYASLLGILRWMVEMGRLDICCETSMMSLYVAMPIEKVTTTTFSDVCLSKGTS